LFFVAFLGLILVPHHLRGLAERIMVLPLGVWLLLTGLRLRQPPNDQTYDRAIGKIH